MSLKEKQSRAQEAANKCVEKRAQIEKDRLRPWSSAPGFKIGKFDVYPLSLRSIIDLEVAGNAFFTQGQILSGDVAAYIWRHLPEYDLSDPRYNKNYKRFLRKVKKETLARLVEDIKQHLKFAFIDNPAVSSFGGLSKSYKMPATTGIASLCHEYGAAYGVNPVDVADIDLRIVFQCCRAIRMSQGNCKFSEPEDLIKAKSEYLKIVNG